ncbi:MAG: cadmium-translocating P-type ATPase [Firmicutes bacterium]|nr:cadmium-translocating P-type ATPase [Bacillota bacterium]
MKKGILTKSQKFQIMRICISAVLLALAMLLPVTGWGKIVLFLAAYAVVAYPVLWEALLNIIHGQVFDENFLMALASIGALGMKAFSEAVAVMLFYSVGELFESYAVNKSRRSITELMDIKPDHATLLKNGIETVVDPGEVSPGDLVIVKPGEKVPLDGTVEEGTSSVDTSALTGESIPVDVSEGDDISSGCVNLSGLLTVRVTKEFGESTVSKILDLVENAASKKAPTEKFITKFARYYTPAVVAAAVILAFVPQIFEPAHPVADWFTSEWVYRALMFLVVSCPCALVISVPLSFFGGIGAASRKGILIKGSSYMESLTKIDTAIFDKTGTLTTGVFKVTDVKGPDDTLMLAAYAENYSSHPISLSIKEAYGEDIDENRIKGVHELAGKGISAIIDGRQIYAGNATLMKDQGIEVPESSEPGTLVYVAEDDKYHGHILISDEIKDDSAEALASLREQGIKTVMLTGDRDVIAEHVAEKLGITETHSQLLPSDKVALAEKIIDSDESGKVMFTGDGINDAPVLARADIGVAMGGMGSEAAIEAADVVIMDDKLSKLRTIISIAKRTMSIAKQNIVFALTVKAVILVISAIGLGNMWLAIFADVGVSVIAILNSMRTLVTRE